MGKFLFSHSFFGVFSYIHGFYLVLFQTANIFVTEDYSVSGLHSQQRLFCTMLSIFLIQNIPCLYSFFSLIFLFVFNLPWFFEYAQGFTTFGLFYAKYQQQHEKKKRRKKNDHLQIAEITSQMLSKYASHLFILE